MGCLQSRDLLNYFWEKVLSLISRILYTIYEPLGLPGRSVDYDGKLIGNDMAYHVAAILMTFTDLGGNLSRLKLF